MANHPRRGSRGYFSEWDQRRPSRDFTGGNDPYTNYRGRHDRDYEDPSEYRSRMGYGDRNSYRDSGYGDSGRDRDDYGSRYDQDYGSGSYRDYGDQEYENRSRNYGSSGSGYGSQGGYGRYGSAGSGGYGFSEYDRGNRGSNYNRGETNSGYDWDRESSGYSGGRGSRESSRYGRGYDYDRGGRYGDRDNRSHGNDERDWWDRTGDEISSWFGDDEAKRRREMDKRESHRGKGPKGYRRSDERIQEDISDRFSDDSLLDPTDIDIKVDDGEVTLSGSVTSRIYKRRAEDIAEGVSGVKNVENRIRVNQDAGYTSTAGTGATTSSTERSGTTSTGGMQNASERNRTKQTT